MHNFIPIKYKRFAVAQINLQIWRHSGIFVCSWLAEVVSSCSPIFKSCILVSFKVVTFNKCKDRMLYAIKHWIAGHVYSKGPHCHTQSDAHGVYLATGRRHVTPCRLVCARHVLRAFSTRQILSNAFVKCLFDLSVDMTVSAGWGLSTSVTHRQKALGSDVIIANHFWLLRRNHWDFPNSFIFVSNTKENCNKNIIFFSRDKANVHKIFTNFWNKACWYTIYSLSLHIHTVTTVFSSSANNAMFEYSKDLPNARLYHLSVTWILCSFPMLRKIGYLYIQRVSVSPHLLYVKTSGDGWLKKKKGESNFSQLWKGSY